jgi:hypothetical protein
MKLRLALSVVLLAACHEHDHEHDDKKKEGEHGRGETVDEPAHVEKPAHTSAAQEAIAAYESAPDCATREQQIVWPALNHDALAKLGCSKHTAERIEAAECDDASKTTCHATARTDKTKKRYWLVKQPNGKFLVDFRATERPNHLDALRQLAPGTPFVVRGRVYASVAYSDEFRGKKQTHYAVRLRALSGEPDKPMYGYIARDTDDGRALEALVGTKTGGTDYEVTLVVAYPPTKLSGDTVAIKRFLAPDLFQSDAENAFEARDGGT